MTTVLLYGHLAKTFGHRWRLDVSSPAEAVRALMANRRDFQAYMIQHSAPGYRVFVGKDSQTPETLHYPAGRQAIKIVPVIAGAAKDPTIQIIAGSILVAAVAALIIFAPPVGIGLTLTLMAGSMGASMVLGGISQLLAGNPAAPDISEKEANRPSFLFNGIVNTTAQGHCVPVGYGRMRVGSAVISAGIMTEDIAP